MCTATVHVLAAVVLLIVQFVYCSAQGGCSPPAGILTTGDDKLTNNVPTILTSGGSHICKLEHGLHLLYHIRFTYRSATKNWWSGNKLVGSVQ